ncbi:MAG TPA: 4,5-DOPA dioxygenase extradiol, partial [Saprospiraceae bacterium]|nr:4,5-DOPA dioxygenase extradiol [Saprospiraceae bacterium]
MNDVIELSDTGTIMPALFVGHGSPTNAIEDNEFSRAWVKAGQSLPIPKAILCISAHWMTNGTRVTAMEKPKTIHDFSGFPQELYRMQYPAEGSPALARLTEQIIKTTSVEMDFNWGLDHGTWSVLCRMFPDADIPVVQLSLDGYKEPQQHYELGVLLQSLRNKGVLIIGSGNMVHNLMMLSWQDTSYDWAVEFDEKLKELILSGDHDSIVHYERLGRSANLSIPTNE